MWRPLLRKNGMLLSNKRNRMVSAFAPVCEAGAVSRDMSSKQIPLAADITVSFSSDPMPT